MLQVSTVAIITHGVLWAQNGTANVLNAKNLPYLRKGDSMDVGLSSGITSPTLQNSI